MRVIFFGIIVFLLVSCGGGEEQVFAPKPRMYPKVDFPVRDYRNFDEDYCDLTFSYPSYAEIIQDTSFFDEKPNDPCWFDVVFSGLNGRLHCSYYPIDQDNSFDALLKDAFTFVEKHDIKANYRQETVIENQQDAGGILFEIDGPVASPMQFFLTDSTDHFIRASLYFNNQVNPDSMAIIHEFVRADVRNIIETLKFK